MGGAFGTWGAWEKEQQPWPPPRARLLERWLISRKFKIGPCDGLQLRYYTTYGNIFTAALDSPGSPGIVAPAITDSPDTQQSACSGISHDLSMGFNNKVR